MTITFIKNMMLGTYQHTLTNPLGSLGHVFKSLGLGEEGNGIPFDPLTMAY